MSRLFKENRKVLILKKEGFTLLEVLVSMVILAVSLLAIASAEVTSLNLGRGSNEISLAAASGQEILERMQRNRTNLLSYNGFDTDNSATKPGTPGMLQTDWVEWQKSIQKVAGGRGQILVTSGGPIAGVNQVTVTMTIPSRTITFQAVFQ